MSIREVEFWLSLDVLVSPGRYLAMEAEALLDHQMGALCGKWQNTVKHNLKPPN